MSENVDFKRYPKVTPLFIGGVGDEVTGSSCILEIETSDGTIHNIMIDCGAIQGENEWLNYDYPVNGEKIDAVILTHAHYDHVGELALLYKSGFRGKVYMTSNTKKLCMPILIDSAAIQESESRRLGRRHSNTLIRTIENQCITDRLQARRKSDMQGVDSQIDQFDDLYREPLYTQQDVLAISELFESIKLYKLVEIVKNVKIRMLPNTHQNGAVRLEIFVNDPNGEEFGIAFSGDIGSDDSMLYERKCDYTNNKIDAFVLEALHGVSDPVESLDESLKKLYKILKKAKKSKKKVILMGYSLDRNAKLVYALNQFRKKGLIIDCILDSPLTLTELGIYKSTYESDKDWFTNLGDDPFSLQNFKVIKSHREHNEIVLHEEGPCAVVTASANGGGGRVVDYMRNGIQSENFVFVVCGWVPPDSPSRKLIEAEYKSKVILRDGTYVKRCETHWLHGFSSHGYHKEMVTAINDYPNLSTLILNHARNEDKIKLKEMVQEFVDARIIIPDVFSAYSLTKDTFEEIELDNVPLEFGEIVDEREFNYRINLSLE